MTTITAGDTIHFVDSGLTFDGRVRLRGEEFLLTEAQIESTKDRNGVSWLDLSDDEQQARWGKINFQRGPAPENIHPWDTDLAAREARRQFLINEAKRIGHPTEQRIELARIAAEFGTPLTSTTIATYPPDAENRYGPRPA
ncbi:hypothetical protein KZX37_05595 [Microbacterium sp. EYE_5]|uniref:hypothetical protein n=1 Tax=unclassified Microbacterium TaxID=2609290 RepID=UPI002004EF50|nr:MULTISPECIES: hypothetical protein [unclassified Microbacterium]MCK6080094.1 hypothetical protein [Microbacterium sp. EYE_382]MCK6085365.1 hypothetical protein [Microbacterium sp. EYE_384]MCK6122410.1 hypothetical protein [Microbacterium sp. EYE_80]MCK6126128.1 hypothetical protein [Microbacterium sp. EYE_79]MCK6141049.1 hypothetical protein [Microbacterium sp. EYE_39]